MERRLRDWYRRGADEGLEGPDRLARPLHWVQITLQVAARNKVPSRAAFLTVWCLEAVVPLLVLAAAGARVLGLQDELLDAITQVLEQSVLGLEAEQASKLLMPLLEHASVGALGTVGIGAALLLGVQLYALCLNYYNTLLEQRARDRSHWWRGGRFIVFLGWISLLIGGGLLATGAVVQQQAWWALPGPVILSWGCLVFALRAFPACPPSWRSVAVGALVGAFWTEVLKTLFWLQTSLSVGYIGNVYQSLAFLPVFVFWMHFTWFSVLLSIVVAHVSEHRRAFWEQHVRELRTPDRVERTPDGWFAVAVLRALVDRAAKGSADLPALAEAVHAGPDFVSRTMEFLVAEGLAEEKNPGHWLPSEAGRNAEVGTVLARWRQDAAPPPPAGGDPVRDLALDVEQQVQRRVDEVDLDPPLSRSHGRLFFRRRSDRGQAGRGRADRGRDEPRPPG